MCGYLNIEALRLMNLKTPIASGSRGAILIIRLQSTKVSRCEDFPSYKKACMLQRTMQRFSCSLFATSSLPQFGEQLVTTVVRKRLQDGNTIPLGLLSQLKKRNQEDMGINKKAFSHFNRASLDFNKVLPHGSYVLGLLHDLV